MDAENLPGGLVPANLMYGERSRANLVTRTSLGEASSWVSASTVRPVSGFGR